MPGDPLVVKAGIDKRQEELDENTQRGRPIGMILRRIGMMTGLFLGGILVADRVIYVPFSHEVGGQRQRVVNGDMERVENGRLVGWRDWESGYEVDRTVRHGGRCSARCRSRDNSEHHGLTYEIDVHQTTAVPILAEAWSKAEKVSGGDNGDYSLYLDLEYMDGTPLWGQIAAFPPGTHDWRKRSVMIVPEKPVRTVLVHCIFRRRTGTAWFDDVKLWELVSPAGADQFDGLAVEPKQSPLPLVHPDLPKLGLAFFLRDVAAASDIVQPSFTTSTPQAGEMRAVGRSESLGLRLEVTLRRQGDALRLDGEVRDERGEDRAVTVYCAHELEGSGWRWHDDLRRSRPVGSKEALRHWVTVGAGANGLASRYPLACVSGATEALAMAVPLDVPRLVRFACEPSVRQWYAAFDLGLSPLVRASPGRATFSLLLYPCDPEWGFRSALARYYDLVPGPVRKRVRREGIWMPFTDISTVEGFRDFGFQFQEGGPNIAFDEQHGIDSFVYVEPMSLWVALPKEMERSNEKALAYVREKAAAGDDQMRAALCSAIYQEGGEWSGGVVKAPWCDGAFYVLNPAPLPTLAGGGGMTQFEHEWGTIDRAFHRGGSLMAAWRPWEDGYVLAPRAGRRGSTAARMSRIRGARGTGASQTIVLKQQRPLPVTARVWTRSEGVSGEPDENYSLYIDLTYADGTPGWGFVRSAPGGSHDWVMLEQRIVPKKPIHSLSFHLLFRQPRTGRVWFDDASLVEAGDAGGNRLRKGDFEPGRDGASAPAAAWDGVYIDSYEMAADKRNYRREHFADSEFPLVFDRDGRLCELGIFTTVAFTREVARRMWSRNKLMFANSTPFRFPWGAAWLDIMGTETNWAPRGAYAPPDDAMMIYHRALCYQRPYVLLLNTVYDTFKPEWVERYFMRCLAYGFYPSFFSHNAADDPYWGRPDLYNRDRPLFRRFIPVIKALGTAGWEPVTHARCGDASVYIERFGRAGGPLYLTVFNDSRVRRTVEITVDGEALGLVGEAGKPHRLVLGPEEATVLTLAGPELRLSPSAISSP